MKKPSLLLGCLLLCLALQARVAVSAQENSVPQEKERLEVKCPKKAAVALETVRAETFFEYRHHPLLAQPGSVAVKSPAAGKLTEVQIGEGSLVFAGQEILAIETISGEELASLEADVAASKKIWNARLNWKEKSERAIKTAEKKYNEALALLEEKKASSRKALAAPATGRVHFVQDLGSEVAADAVLLEIANPGRMIYTLSGNGRDEETFAVGQTLDGSAGSIQGRAEVIAVSAGQVTFMVDNAAGLLKEGMAFEVKTLKAEHAGAVAVPASALFQDSLGDFVYVVEKKRAKKLYVTRGASEAGRTLIEKGLAAGAQLIVSGFECLADKKKIRVINPEPVAAEPAGLSAESRAQATVADAAAEQAVKDEEKERQARAELEARQAAAAAAAELKAKKQEEKKAKDAAEKARKEEEAKAKAQAKLEARQAAAAKPACAKRVPVLTELTRTGSFSEYRFYSAPALPEAIAVASPAAGRVHAMKVSEGSPVAQGQELLVLSVGEDDEVAALRLEAERRRNALQARQDAKVKNERSIRAAELAYQKALERLEEKVAPFIQPLAAPVAGTVQNIQVAPGADVAGQAVLLEILTEQLLRVTLAVADPSRFVSGEKVAGKVEGLQAEWSAEVIDVRDSQVLLRLDNSSGQGAAGKTFTARQLKAEHADAVTVPSEVLFQDNLGDFVYVAEKKKAKKLYVTPGASEAGRTHVAAGLGTGMTLIVSGFECLADGKKVRLVDEEELAKEQAAAEARRQEKEAKESVPRLPGIDEFIAYIEANRETLQYESYERTQIKKQPALKILSGLETQKKLIELVLKYDVEKISFELQDERVLSTLVFKTGVKEEKTVQAEKAPVFGERLRFAVHGTYYVMFDQKFKDAYVSLNGFGGSLAFRFARKMDFWVSGGVAAKNNQPAWSPVEMKFRLTPLAAAVRYYLMEKGKLSAFAGAGANVFLVKDENPIENIKTTVIGFNALAGGYYRLSKKIFGQLYLKFNMASKDVYPDSDLDDPLNLSGLELNLGFGILL